MNEYISFHLLYWDNSMGNNTPKKGDVILLRKDRIEAIQFSSNEKCRVIFDVKDPQYGFYKAFTAEIKEELGIK